MQLSKKRLLTRDSIFDNNVMGLICGDKILPKFLWYILNSFDISQWASLANPPSISKDAVLNQLIPLPTLDIQSNIVKELDCYQEIINGAQRVVKNYIPIVTMSKHWKEVAVGDLFEIVLETIDPSTKTGEVTCIGLENIEANSGRIVGLTDCDFSTLRSLKRVFKSSDILFGKLRPALNKVTCPGNSGICSTDIIVLRAKQADIIPEFYSHLLRQPNFNSMVLNGVSGGQLPRIDTEYLLQLPVYKVPFDEQIQILQAIHKEQELTEAAEQLVNVFGAKIVAKVKEIWGE